MSGVRTAYSAETDSAKAAASIVDQLSGCDARVLVFFAGIKQDGRCLGNAFSAAFPSASVIGCSTDGEFCDKGFGKGGVSAIALSSDIVGASATAMVDAGHDLQASVMAAGEAISSKLGRPIRELDPSHYMALVLVEGAKMREELVNEALGDMAPFLPFVGASASDDITFTATWAYANGVYLVDGTALLVAEMRVPFKVLKTCSAEPMEHEVRVTKCIPSRRRILELNGEPAADYYAKLLGTTRDELTFSHYVRHPLGLMIDGEPWLRSVLKADGTALFMACAVVEGAELRLMQTTDMVPDARIKLSRMAEELGRPLSGAIFFNCAYRMLEAAMDGKEQAYQEALASLPHAGMHSNGESYLGHINHTLTGVVF